MPETQQSRVCWSQHPPIQWNLRGGRWSSFKISYIKKNILKNVPLSCVSSEAGGVGELYCNPVTRKEGYSVSDAPNTKIQQTPLPAETLFSSPERDSRARWFFHIFKLSGILKDFEMFRFWSRISRDWGICHVFFSKFRVFFLYTELNICLKVRPK